MAEIKVSPNPDTSKFVEDMSNFLSKTDLKGVPLNDIRRAFHRCEDHTKLFAQCTEASLLASKKAANEVKEQLGITFPPEQLQRLEKEALTENCSTFKLNALSCAIGEARRMKDEEPA